MNARRGLQQPSWDRLAGLAVVLALHAAGLYALWQYQIRITPQEAVTLFVNFINPPPPVKQEEPPKPRPRPKPVDLPPPEPPQIVVEAPVVLPEEPVAPPPPEPIIEAPPAPPEPVRLVAELSVSCPKRTPPVYPAVSRRMGEEGRVVLWVELDEQGRVMTARVDTRSGSARLDDAALAAVKTWRCTPATRDGAPVRAIALQPFVFSLEGR
jgi:protein TonB